MRDLPAIPVIELGRRGLDALADELPERFRAVVAVGAKAYTPFGMALVDRASRAWADGHPGLPYRGEIEALQARLAGKPGAWIANLNYEWGCTTAAAAHPSGPNLLYRVLDWQLSGLGAMIVAAWRDGAAGRWLNMTWPGVVGVVQGHAPGRFSAAINQAPPRAYGFGKLSDWPMARLNWWRKKDGTPATLLLRRAFDECADFAAAKKLLQETPLAAPAFFTLVGPGEGETIVIERRHEGATTHEGRVAISNHWLSQNLAGPDYVHSTRERLEAMRNFLASDMDQAADFLKWVAPPMFNERTRLAFIADPASGKIVLQGFEKDGPVTQALVLGG